MAHLSGADLSLGLPYSGKSSSNNKSGSSDVLNCKNTNTAEVGAAPFAHSIDNGKRQPMQMADLLNYLGINECNRHLDLLPKILLSTSLGVPSMMVQQGGDLSPSLPGAHTKGMTDLSPNRNSSSQLTLFYGGTVNVFDNVPIDKAQLIMSLAGHSSQNHVKEPKSIPCSSVKMDVSSVPQTCIPFSPQGYQRLQNLDAYIRTNLSTGNKFMAAEDGQSQNLSCLLTPCQAVVPKALPLARKASLARFLETRKERIKFTAPYLQKERVILPDVPPRYCNKERMGSNSHLSENDSVSENHVWCLIDENTKQVSACSAT